MCPLVRLSVAVNGTTEKYKPAEVQTYLAMAPPNGCSGGRNGRKGQFLGRTGMKIGLYGVVCRQEAACETQKFVAPQKSLIFDVFQKTSLHLMMFVQF